VLAAALLVPFLLTTIGITVSSAARQDVVEEPAIRLYALPVCYPPAQAQAAASDPPPEPTPTPKPTPWPTPAGVKGLDVSHWNGLPDFEWLRSKGMRFVFSKASQGTSFVDDTYRKHTRQARAAGIVAGAYHFFDYKKNGVRQAEHFLDTVRSKTGTDGLLPLVVDVECLKSIGTSNHANAKRRLHDMLDELYRQTGRYPMIYTSRVMWTRVVGAPKSFGGYPLWVACWKCDDIYMPNGWKDWRFWQVGQFRFNKKTKLDGNVYRASMSRLHTEKARAVRLEDGATYTKQRTVEADLRGVDGKVVRVALDSDGFGPWQPYKPRFGLDLARRQGEQLVRIQLRSFRGVRSPVFRDSIVLDSVPPAIDGPRIRIASDTRMPRSGERVPVVASVKVSDATSGIDWGSLGATCDGTKRARASAVDGRAELTTRVDREGCKIVGSAADVAGHRKSKRLDPTISLIDVRRSSKRILLKGPWRVKDQKASLKSTLAQTSSAGAVARVVFEGAQVAVVARRGPAGGRVKVQLDGKKVGTIDLYADAGQGRRIVFVKNVVPGKHALKLVTTGTGSAESSGSYVWLDAVLVLDRRR
jgi:GH25 family lysozyme M1 (1,4-beta-N-acetylmuramidase)